MKIINTTPHSITFSTVPNLAVEALVDGEWASVDNSSETLSIPPCGVKINARVEEKVVWKDGDVVFVQSSFVRDEENVKALQKLDVFGTDVIVGSIIAAQAYPGRVVAMTPSPGFERVEPEKKRMNLLKFTIF